MSETARHVYLLTLCAVAGPVAAGDPVVLPEPGIPALLGLAGVIVALAIIYKRRR
jgi:hypothetical protein